MRTEELGKSRIANLVFAPAGRVMESRLRRVLTDPEKLLAGAGVRPGETVLEVGSGTGFFTLDAARMVGEAGRLIAMEPLAAFADRLTARTAAAGLRHVEVIRRDALTTQLPDASIDRVLLFGVLPHASLPLKRLLPEMHRILKPGGTLAVWLFPFPLWVPRSIRRSGLFGRPEKRHRVYTYRQC